MSQARRDPQQVRSQGTVEAILLAADHEIGDAVAGQVARGETVVPGASRGDGRGKGQPPWGAQATLTAADDRDDTFTGGGQLEAAVPIEVT